MREIVRTSMPIWAGSVQPATSYGRSGRAPRHRTGGSKPPGAAAAAELPPVWGEIEPVRAALVTTLVERALRAAAQVGSG